MGSGRHIDLSWKCLSFPLRVETVVWWDSPPPPRICRGLCQEDGDDGSLRWFLGKGSLWTTWTTASPVKLLPSNFISVVGTTLTNLYLWNPVANQKRSVRKGTHSRQNECSLNLAVKIPSVLCTTWKPSFFVYDIQNVMTHFCWRGPWQLASLPCEG